MKTFLKVLFGLIVAICMFYGIQFVFGFIGGLVLSITGLQVSLGAIIVFVIIAILMALAGAITVFKGIMK